MSANSRKFVVAENGIKIDPTVFDRLELAEPIYAHLPELMQTRTALLEVERAIQNIHVKIVQPLIDAIWSKAERERDVKSRLLEAKGVSALSDLPLAWAEVVLRLQKQVLEEDGEYVATNKKIAELSKALKAAQLDAHEHQRASLSAALEAALEV